MLRIRPCDCCGELIMAGLLTCPNCGDSPYQPPPDLDLEDSDV